MDTRELPSAPPPHQILSSPNPYAPSTAMNPPNSGMQNPSFSYNTHYGDGSHSGGGGFTVETAKKKRGRPRKYSPDGNTSLGLSTNPNPSSASMGTIVPFNASVAESGGGGSASDPTKKGRGRPPGSGKKQLDALGGPAGVGFTPHVILAKAGEDICSKIMAFAQQGPRTICLLSANGAVSNASICHSKLSGAIVTYEGRYEIISLRGSFTQSESSNVGRSTTGGLSVTLAGPDGQVLGGCLSGMLIAASPVQIIVGSFIEEEKKAKPAPPSTSPVPNMLNFGAPVAPASPQSQGPSSASSDENGGASPYDGGSAGPYTNDSTNNPHHSMPMYSHSGWPTGQ